MVFRENFLACPACSAALDRLTSVGHTFHRCSRCHAMWIDAATLSCMFADMVPPVEELAFAARTGDGSPARACPACRELMTKELLEDVPVERCFAHGIFFTPGGLEDAFRNAARSLQGPAARVFFDYTRRHRG